MAPRLLTFLALMGSAACDDDPSPTVAEPGPEWLSEPDYRIGDAMTGDAAFGWVPYLHVSPDGRRVFVLEPNQARVTVWTPEGRLLLDLGRPGEGPGDFMLPYRIHAWESGFHVRDQVRFTFFSYEGALLRTVPNPPTLVSWQGFPIRVNHILADGSFLGDPSIPASIEVGLWGHDPIDSVPVLRVREAAGEWSREPVVWRSILNSLLVYSAADGDAVSFGSQPYSASDLYVPDRSAGTVVAARHSRDHLGPGEVEFLEVTADGDTTWRRRLGFRPVRLTRQMLDATIDREVEGVSEMAEANPGFLGIRSAREVVEDALYVPEYLPAVDVFLLASSGRHIWIKSLERVDTLRVWYSVERDGGESPPRRVLLPESVQFWDMTDTHVWGIWKDELDINYVVGRRLVPAS